MKGAVLKGKNSKFVIGKYSYYQYDTLGKGFSSQVFKGTNQKNGKQVAIKVIKVDPMNKKLHQNLIKSQLEIIQEIQGLPYVLNVLDFFELNKKFIIVSQLCQTDLHKQIKKKTVFSEEKAIQVIGQILSGYRNLQQRQIIHRDLKPANILFKNRSVKIADFGFSVKLVNLSKCENVGSPAYMSPQALQNCVYSFKSDIWSIGVIFYEMIVGRTWTSRGQTCLLNNIKKNPIETLLPNHISQISKTFLRKTLAVNSDQRIQPKQLFAFNFQLSKKQVNQSLSPKKTYSFSLSQSNKVKATQTHNTINSYSIRKRQCSFEIQNQLDRKAIVSPLKNNLDHLRNTAVNPQIIAIFSNYKVGFPTKKSTPCKNDAHDSMNKLLQFYTKHSKKSINEIVRDEKNSLSAKILDSLQQCSKLNKGSLNSTTEKLDSNKKLNGSISILNNKQISNQLLSKLNFCRFSAKIITKILLNSKDLEKAFLQKQQLQNLVEQMYGLITTVFNDISNLSYYRKAETQSYLGSNEYQKINDLVKVYMKKYLQQLSLNSNWKGFRSLLKITKEAIIKLYTVIKKSQNFNEAYNQIVIVDLLITFFQIVQLLRSKDNNNMLSKQKMQQIAEGRSIKSVSQQHILGIKMKLIKLKIISER